MIFASAAVGMMASVPSHLVADKALGHRTTGGEAITYLVEGGIVKPGGSAALRYRHYGMSPLKWVSGVFRGSHRGF